MVATVSADRRETSAIPPQRDGRPRTIRGRPQTFMTIALVGMMGAGKSTIGRHLANHLGVTFIDVDLWVEIRAGKSIARIFEEDGETAFREMETNAALEALQEVAVVSLGGGAFISEAVRNECLAKAVVVYLKVSADELVRRVEFRPAVRPLVADEPGEKIRALLYEREPIYEMAHVTFETDHKEPSEAAKALAKILIEHEAN